MPWSKTGASQYNAQSHLGLPDKGRAIKGLLVYNDSESRAFGLTTIWPWVVINCPLLNYIYQHNKSKWQVLFNLTETTPKAFNIKRNCLKYY